MAAPIRGGSRSALVIMVLALAWSLTPQLASAQPSDAPLPRPLAFYIVQRPTPPTFDLVELPAAARTSYKRLQRAEADLRAAMHRRPRPPESKLLALDTRERDAVFGLFLTLNKQRAKLTPQGAFALAEAAYRRRTFEFIDASERFGTRLDRGEEPGIEPVLRLGEPLRLWRVAAERSGPTQWGFWSTFMQAHCSSEMGQDAAAELLFRRVAMAREPSTLVAEAQFRLGESLFERGAFGEAARWYARVVMGSDTRLQILARYKLAWAHLLAGDPAAAIAAADRMPIAANAELLSDLVELRQAAQQRLSAP